MTGDQSRTLGVGDRVRWGATTTDFGTVVENDLEPCHHWLGQRSDDFSCS